MISITLNHSFFIDIIYIDMTIQWRKSSMKDLILITIIGFIMYIMLSIIDKFIYTVPNIIYIPIGILSIIFVLMGSFINLKSK